MPSFTQAELNTSTSYMISGSISAAIFLTIANDAVKDVLLETDLRSSKRKTALSPNLFNDVFEYTCPSTLKANKIIDIRPQINRGVHDYWRLTTEEEFDRMKNTNRIDSGGEPVTISMNADWLGENLVAISDDDLVRKLLVSRPISDTTLSIDQLDTVGDWLLFGDGTNLTADSSNYVKGSGSINWDISAAGGVTAGIQNSSLSTFDVTPYASLGSAFIWVYITSITNLTNFILLIGSSSSVYYKITITSNNEGVSFYNGWNLLRFDFANKAETGTVDQDACDYAAIYMTKAAGKVSETDYRFDNLVLKIGDHYDVIYYSKYLWQSSAGVFLEEATTTTDVLNVEADEISLIQLKTAFRLEQYLKNYKNADRLDKKYLQMLGKYIQDNPSEILTLTQQYYNL